MAGAAAATSIGVDMESPGEANLVAPQPALLVDLYELTMGEAYLAEGLADRPATFELLCRHLPNGWGYLVASGLDDVLDYLEQLRFTNEELMYLETTRLFSARFLDRLAHLRFTGDVRALPEGALFFPNEPVLEIAAPLLEAQLVETMVLNQIHFQSLIAAKAARCVDAAGRRRLVDFSLRRTHGGEAGLKVARASYLAGFDATSNVLAGQRYGIPIAGTMAHSYIECFEDEAAAFASFARAYPVGSTLLIDTYDTVEGARRAARVASADAGLRLGGVRLDSGDLLELSRRVRQVLDEAALRDVTIFASGNLDEREIARLLGEGAPIDGFGVGSRLGVSADAPYLDMAYKLVAFDGRPTLKLSDGKATLPGEKQTWRGSQGGLLASDVVSLLEEEGPPGHEPLLNPVMLHGRRLGGETLAAARARAAKQRTALAPEFRLLDARPYPVELSAQLAALRDTLTTTIRASLRLPPARLALR
ncbi:MAG: nicotinate phosphoribosyltransferase [Gaiellaceae bacterium]